MGYNVSTQRLPEEGSTTLDNAFDSIVLSGNCNSRSLGSYLTTDQRASAHNCQIPCVSWHNIGTSGQTSIATAMNLASLGYATTNCTDFYKNHYNAFGEIVSTECNIDLTKFPLNYPYPNTANCTHK